MPSPFSPQMTHQGKVYPLLGFYKSCAFSHPLFVPDVKFSLVDLFPFLNHLLWSPGCFLET